MNSKKLLVNVFWGEHRTSELLAISVKNALESDQDIKKIKVPFVEYKEYLWNDYIELIYRRKEQAEEGVNSEEFDRILREEKNPMINKYNEQLFKEYGPLSFNLHDGAKIEYNLPDVGFWIPETIKEDKELSDLLLNIGKKHGLSIETRLFRKTPDKKFCVASPSSIIVELYQPSPEQTMHYSSTEIKELAKEHTPAKHGPWYQEQVAKTEHPLFIEASNKYSAYLKEILLTVDKMNFSLWGGNGRRMN